VKQSKIRHLLFGIGESNIGVFMAEKNINCLNIGSFHKMIPKRICCLLFLTSIYINLLTCIKFIDKNLKTLKLLFDRNSLKYQAI